MLREKIPYDAWLFWCPTDRCNLNCGYCFTPGRVRKEAPLAPIKIPEMTRTLEATGRVFKVHFSGRGEPLLVPNIVEACCELARKHFIAFNTNLTSASARELAARVPADRITGIAATLHIEELKKKRMLRRFIDNYRFCARKNIRIAAEVVAHPSLTSRARHYKDFFKREGINSRFIAFIGSFKGRKYPRSYTDEEIERFGLSRAGIRGFYSKRGLCNAGYNAGVVFPGGAVRPCNSVKEDIGNIYTGIEFRERISACPFRRCSCPLNEIDPRVFELALREHMQFQS